MLTNQEIFDKVSTHLFSQGVRSINGTECAYRGVSGTSCAVGCLIEDDEYSKDMEGYGIDDILLTVEYLPFKNFDEVNSAALLGRLQWTHDKLTNWKSTDEMKKSLKDVANTSGLDDSVLDNLSFNRKD